MYVNDVRIIKYVRNNVKLICGHGWGWCPYPVVFGHPLPWGMATDHPLFLYRYMDRATPRGDSPRFRVRVLAAFPESDYVRECVAKALRSRAGIAPPLSAYGKVMWQKFFTSSPMEEVLTAITITVVESRRQGNAEAYRTAIKTALEEENLGFRIDAQGVIHYAVDEVFEGERTAVLALLNAPALAAAKRAYESVYRHMGSQPPDSLAAARAMFDAVEIVARQLCPAHRNLHAGLCRGELRERCLAALGGDSVEQLVWAGMFTGLVEWVSALHNIRHGQPRNTAPLSETFAVYAISSGTAYLRLLAGVAIQVGVQAAQD